ncbi:MAG: hypothetical protein JAZ11_15315 [Candidatus Thiodiazotropha lotti]|nr:hypothetical protein [Candidatus Thiodiazotropha lotti]
MPPNAILLLVVTVQYPSDGGFWVQHALGELLPSPLAGEGPGERGRMTRIISPRIDMIINEG